MTLKFNGGNPTLLCDHCATIVAMGNDLPKGILFDLSAHKLYFCSEECLTQYLDKIKKRSKIIKCY